VGYAITKSVVVTSAFREIHGTIAIRLAHNGFTVVVTYGNAAIRV
jgi:NAD(P)-dependent dehydrogenase (short-subunit alcohol dehydrogenase family)